MVLRRLLCLAVCSTVMAQYQIAIGPEIYHVDRTRVNGTYQNGVLYGGRFEIDRIKPCAWYWGGDILFADGELHGQTGRNMEIVSDYDEFQVEGRFGYQFACKCLQFTPLIGIGYFRQTNSFGPPIRYPLCFHTDFTYYEAGFLSQICVSCLSVGLNFKMRFMYDAENRITGHPRGEHIQPIGTEGKYHYVVEMPITYWQGRVAFSFVPFWRLRRYGGSFVINGDFYDTRFEIYGARFLFNFIW